MKFTDIFINKPVLATVVSLIILLLGLRAGNELNVRKFPELQNAVINVSTAYIGADADLVQGFITTPIERLVATVDGINYMVSSSVAGISTVSAHVRLDADPDKVLTKVIAKVNKLRGELPAAAENSVIELRVGDPAAHAYLAFYSESLTTNQITDYLIREVEPRLSTVPGVQRADISGGRTFAVRAWLKPERLRAFSLTASDIANALRSNNVLSAVGATKGAMLEIDLKADTDLRSIDEFKRMIVRSEGGSIIRLEDVAEVELGSENYATSARFNGKQATFFAIYLTPDANAVEVLANLRKVWDDEVVPQLPEGLKADFSYDSSIYIRDSIAEVKQTISEAILIVIVVIFLFLGSMRSVVVPAVAVPLSLVGALFLMLLMGFSLNLLTLLAMVLAIGIVVDDAIIVLENIHRHIEHGMTPKQAALRGARELAWPVVAMTTTLVAVYLPIGFLSGITGVLFVEFAFTLAGAVLISGIVALTLSPMMCAKLLRAKRNDKEGGLENWLDRQFEKLQHAYQRDLHVMLDQRLGIAIFGVIVLVSCYFLFVMSPTELAPTEDVGLTFYIAEADPGVSLEYVERFSLEAWEIHQASDAIAGDFQFNGMSVTAPGSHNGAFGGLIFAPWSERDVAMQDVLNDLITPRFSEVSGLQVAALIPPALPTGGTGMPIEFVVVSTAPTTLVKEFADEIVNRAKDSKKFIFLNTDVKINKPRTDILIDRDKASQLGIDMAQLSADLSAMLSGGYVNRFSLDNRSYKVVPQVERAERLTPQQLEQYYTRTQTGELVPLSTIVSLKDSVQPQVLSRFQQLNSVTIGAVPRPNIAYGDALGMLEDIAADVLPKGYTVDYAGQSRQFKTEGSALVVTFFFALVVIYLVLSAQFESFRDPIIMLVTVPMSICGALLVLNFLGLFRVPGATLNIYTQIGLLTLIGVISKHGILIVEFANKLQSEGRSKRQAIEEAAAIRLRPVLMTTAALVLAMLPMLVASGPGAISRFSMGLVIAAGMTIGTAFTLYVLPAVYLFIGRDYAKNPLAVVEEELPA
ncbi:efflux RND transporter permease subunit [Halioxenophilus sp. WMMB6]|uniref:efflux RND transporter permease subunit n=1 Tax=Halioxenophilus sp. WMMB6 TaxID=3073815 RepID=UPI00295F48BE|nr:efflux RND transporter permease subunit [Halioxenophilus sp. WMMB6]